MRLGLASVQLTSVALAQMFCSELVKCKYIVENEVVHTIGE